MMKKHSLVLLAAIVIGAGALSSCFKNDLDNDELTNRSAGPATPPPPPPVAEKQPEPPKYVYGFSGQREPFLPLVGAALASSSDAPEDIASQNFANLELKGILRDKTGKVAVISSTDGEAYTLKSGRIYDKRNHMVEGVSGIIKEHSVVLVSKNKTVKELTLIRNEGQTTTR